MTLPSLIGLSGSLRRESYNTIILESLIELLAGRAVMAIHLMHDLPHYNQDRDTVPAPEAVARLRAAVAAADGVIVATPEFNHGIPGTLKNALDWLSRPRGEAALTGKPVLTITSSLAVTGGVRAHAQLNETLLSIASRLVVRPQAVVGSVHEKVRGRRLVDRETLNFLSNGADDMIRMIGAPAPVQIEQS